MTLAEFIPLLLAVYSAGVLVLILGLRRLRDDRTGEPPTVSVIIAARNEHDQIAACIDSVCRQSCDAGRYEVIVVDDDSHDRTSEVVRARMTLYPHLRLLPVRNDPDLRGKARPLAQGIEAATGEVILITDADCRVPSTWVEATARRYAHGVGQVGGITLQESATAFGAMQSLDWAYLLGIAASTVAYGWSFGSIGNNLSFRKSAYDEVGGYRALPFSVTEDYTLVAAIRRTGHWRQLYPIDPEIVVESKPCPDLRSLIRQKHRWGKGGLEVPISGYFIMMMAWLINALPLVHLFVWGAWGHTLTIFMIKAAVDYAFLFSVLRRIGRTGDLRHFAVFELYFGAYALLLPFLVVFGGKVEWKERVY